MKHSGCFCAAEEAWSENAGEISCHHMILVTTAKFYPKPGRLLALLLGLSSAEIVPLCFHKLPSVLK